MPSGMDVFGRVLMAFGALLLVVGALLTFGGRWLSLGRLPGDIVIQRGNFTFFFPIVSMLILSAVLTLLLNLLFRR